MIREVYVGVGEWATGVYVCVAFRCQLHMRKWKFVADVRYRFYRSHNIEVSVERAHNTGTRVFSALIHPLLDICLIDRPCVRLRFYSFCWSVNEQCLRLRDQTGAGNMKFHRGISIVIAFTRKIRSLEIFTISFDNNRFICRSVKKIKLISVQISRNIVSNNA